MTRRIAMFAAGAMVVLLGVWFMLLWSPKGSELDDARAQNAAAGQKVSELQVKLDRLKDGERREPELLAAKDRLVSAVPERPELAEFILAANDAATKAGVDFVSISPAPPAAPKIPGAPPSINVKLAVSGDYFATLDFLDRLADLPRIVVLDAVQLHPSGDNAQLSADLGGSIFTTQAPALPLSRATTSAGSTASSTTTTTVKP